MEAANPAGPPPTINTSNGMISRVDILRIQKSVCLERGKDNSRCLLVLGLRSILIQEDIMVVLVSGF